MTTADDIRTALDRGIGARRLLDHAFYRRWEAGSLGDGELARYAEQYRHFEAAVPRVLESCLATLADDTARAAVIRNLDDEAHGDRPHVDLFDDFARSVAARPAAPATAATTVLLDSLDGDGPAGVITALLTYEWQSPAVATTKANALRAHYGPCDATFWDVHAGVDDAHAAWLIDALAAIDADPGTVEGRARATAERWWAFLDDRQSEAATA